MTDKIIEFFCYCMYYVTFLIIVSACWVGLEYALEGSVHSSDVDGIVAMILSWFITNKCIKRQ